MIRYMNRHMIAGYIGNQPSLRYMSNGQAVMELSVATSHSFKDKNNQWQTEAEWHTCVIYREDAEQAANTYHKGDAICLEGRVYTRKWLAKDGRERSRKEIIVEMHHKLEAKPNHETSSDGLEDGMVQPTESFYDKDHSRDGFIA